MLVLLAALAVSAPPTLSCERLEVSIADADEAAKTRPKGFWWEGWDATAVLEDGRIVLSRQSALERLSRKDLKRQHTNNAPDRVMQVAVLSPDGKLESSATMARGTLLEALGLPGGGVVIARTAESITAIDHLDKKGAWTGSVFLRGDPQADKIWRKHNPLKATGPSRLTPVGPKRVVSWHAGIATSFDLEAHEADATANVWPLGVFVLRGRRLATHELFVADQSRQLRWMDADLQSLRTENCAGCRVVGLDKVVPFDSAEGSWLPGVRQRAASVAVVDGDGLTIQFRGLSGRERELEPIRVEAPAGKPGRDWTWRFREGPWGSALLTTSTKEGAHTASALQPGADGPVWTWTAPAGVLRDGEELVADALGPYVRVRVVTGQGLEEKTRLGGLIDPSSGVVSDLVKPSSLNDPLAEALSSPWVARHFAGDVLLRNPEDPVMARTEPGDSVAALERCRVRLTE